MSRPPTMKHWINRGRAVLEAEPEPPRKNERMILRLYIVSAGHELLRFDSAPMTWQAADQRKLPLAPQNSMAVRVEVYEIGQPRTEWKRARLVVMPAQAPPPEELIEQAA